MADEPDNLVLVQLREIRAMQGEMRAILEFHNKRFDKLESRFDDFDKKNDEWRGYVTQALGLCGIGHIKNEQQDARLDTQDGERKRLAEQVTALDGRVSRIEERLDT